MQSINRQAPTLAFIALVGGTAIVSVGVGVQAILQRDDPGAGWVGVGTLAYVAALAIAGGFNVPRNGRLAALDASTPEAATVLVDLPDRVGDRKPRPHRLLHPRRRLVHSGDAQVVTVPCASRALAPPDLSTIRARFDHPAAFIE